MPVDFDRTTNLAGANGYGYKSQYDAMEAWRSLRGPDVTYEANVDVCGTVDTQSGPWNLPPATPDLYVTPSPSSL